ncbi:MAG: glycosyltransferase family 9 protein [Pseudomonadota bacterium]|nr:glycosyltransferase family 9 protein [Pseudomonadota bacterium]
MADILVIKLGSLGDIIQAMGAIQDIRLHHPDDRISVITTGPWKRLFERCPWVDAVLVGNRAPRWRLDRFWAVARLLRSRTWTRVYDLQNSGRTELWYRWFLKDTPWSGQARGSSMHWAPPARRTVPIVERLSAQLAVAGVPARYTPLPDASWMADDISALLEEAGVKEPFAVLLPGSSRAGAKKRWPHYAALAQRLKNRGWTVVTVPGPDEADLCRPIPGICLTGGSFLDLFQLAGVLRRAALVIGNDSGPVHLASHLGTPGIALFGPAWPAALTGIRRPGFETLEVPSLADLSVDEAEARILHHPAAQAFSAHTEKTA